MYAYCWNNPVMNFDVLGFFTKSTSITVNATAIFGVSLSIGYSTDDKGNIVLFYSKAIPSDNDTMYIGGVDAGIALSKHVTVLDNVDELTGLSGSIGVSGGDLGYLGADAIFLPDNYEHKGIFGSSWVGVQLSIGLGAGADVHIMQTETVQTKAFNPGKAIVNWIKSWWD